MEIKAFEGDLEALAVELPEDIARAKAYGNLKLANRLIERRLKKDIPQIMRKRLLLEQEIMGQMEAAYPFDWQSAVKAAQEMFRDFTEEELQNLLEEGAFEWIYRNGEIHLKDDFVLNLVKTREDMADRILQQEVLADKEKNFQMLEAVIKEMKSHDQVICRFHIRSTMKISPAMQRPGKKIQVQLPLPVAGSQIGHVEVIKAEVSVPGKTELAEARIQTAPEDCAQRTICFDAEYQAGMEFSVEFRYENVMKYWNWETAAAEWEKAGHQDGIMCEQEVREADLQEQLPHIRFTPYLKALTAEVIGGENNPVKKAKRIYDYITSHVMYSFVRPYFTIEQQATFTGAGLKGDCGLQALLFITMCRIAGVPARWQSGLYTRPQDVGHHDWAQFYTESGGWRWADCSFGGSAYRAGAMERREFYFGNLDPYRLVAASEYQKDFVFSKKYLRHDPYDNQSGEAEYEDMGLNKTGDFETLHKILSFEMEAADSND